MLNLRKKILLGIAGLVGGLLLFVGANNLRETLMGYSQTPVRVNYTSPISFVSPVKATTTYGSELLTNGDLELWTNTTTAVAWNFIDFSLGGTGATLTQSTTTTGPSSTYSARLENNPAGDSYAYLEQTISCTVGNYYGFGGYFASGAATGTVDFLPLDNESYASSTQYWSAVSSTWVTFDPGSESPGTKEESITNTSSLEGIIVTCPNSGKISWGFIPNASDSPAGAVLYADDLESYEIIYPADITLMDFTNPSDVARMEVGDKVFNFRTTGGTPFNWFYQDGFGKFGTEMTQFDFTTKPLLVTSSAYAYTNAAISLERGYGLVNDPITDIDLTQVGSTTLANIPTGYKIINPMAVLELTEVDGFSVPAQVSVGTTYGDYKDVSDHQVFTLTNLQFAKQVVNLVANSGNRYTIALSSSAPSEREIVFSVNVGATATTMKATVYLYGTLIPN